MTSMKNFGFIVINENMLKYNLEQIQYVLDHYEGTLRDYKKREMTFQSIYR